MALFNNRFIGFRTVLEIKAVSCMAPEKIQALYLAENKTVNRIDDHFFRITPSHAIKSQ